MLKDLFSFQLVLRNVKKGILKGILRESQVRRRKGIKVTKMIKAIKTLKKRKMIKPIRTIDTFLLSMLYFII